LSAAVEVSQASRQTRSHSQRLKEWRSGGVAADDDDDDDGGDDDDDDGAANFDGFIALIELH